MIFGRVADDPELLLEYADTTEAQASTRYNDLRWLKVIGNAKQEPAPLFWPPALHHLEVERASWDDLPQVPPTLRSVTLSRCWKLNALPPGLRRCDGLESVRASGCRIWHVDPARDLPPGLRTLDLSFNQLRSFAYEPLPATLMELDISNNFIRDEPPLTLVQRCIVNAIGNEFPFMLSRPFIDAPAAASPPAASNVYTQSHNVHANSIQESTHDSVAALHRHYMRCRQIGSLPPPSPPREEEIERPIGVTDNNAGKDDNDNDDSGGGGDFRTAFLLRLCCWSRPRPRRPSGRCSRCTRRVHCCTCPRSSSTCRPTAHLREGRPPRRPPPWLTEMASALAPRCCPEGRSVGAILDAWMMDDTTHSRHAMTMGMLLYELWTVVRVHPHRDSILPVLAQEIVDAHGYCFTGRFTRVLNTLCGFVDGIHLEISEQERLQARMPLLYREIPSAVVGEGEGDEGTKQKKRRFMERVFAVLEESRLPEEQWGPWVQPFADALETDVGDHMNAWKDMRRRPRCINAHEVVRANDRRDRRTRALSPPRVNSSDASRV